MLLILTSNYYLVKTKYFTNAFWGITEVHKYLIIIIIIWVNHHCQRVEITILHRSEFIHSIIIYAINLSVPQRT